MKYSRLLIISTLLFLIISLGCITQKEAPVQTETPVPTTTRAPTTIAPITTTPAPTTTTPPTTTPAPTTAPPTTTPAPTTTAPPTTTPTPTTTAPPPTPTLDILNQQETYGPSSEVHVTGEVRNNWDKEVYAVQVSATFYDKYGNVLVTLKSSPVDILPGATESFIIRTEYPKTTVDHYTLEATSPTIPTTTTPTPPTPAPKTELEILDQYEELTPDGKLVIKGDIKNTGNEVLFTVQVSAAFYDQYGNKLVELKSLPITKLSPGETDSFSVDSGYPKTNIASYTLETLSE